MGKIFEWAEIERSPTEALPASQSLGEGWAKADGNGKKYKKCHGK